MRLSLQIRPVDSPPGLYRVDAGDGCGIVSLTLVADGFAWPEDIDRLRERVADFLERNPGLFIRQLEDHRARED